MGPLLPLAHITSQINIPIRLSSQVCTMKRLPEIPISAGYLCPDFPSPRSFGQVHPIIITTSQVIIEIRYPNILIFTDANEFPLLPSLVVIGCINKIKNWNGSQSLPMPREHSCLSILKGQRQIIDLNNFARQRAYFTGIERGIPTVFAFSCARWFGFQNIVNLILFVFLAFGVHAVPQILILSLA